MFHIVIIASFGTLLGLASGQITTIGINSGWIFQYNNKWYEADVPSTIHLDLLKHNLIPDPYLEDN